MRPVPDRPIANGVRAWRIERRGIHPVTGRPVWTRCLTYRADQYPTRDAAIAAYRAYLADHPWIAPVDVELNARECLVPGIVGRAR